MPRVPSYDTPQVESRALPVPRAQSPGPSGLAQAGDAIERVGGQAAGMVGAYVHKAQADAEAVSVIQAETKTQQSAGAIFYDAEQGLLHKRGEDAFKAESLAWDAYDKDVQEAARGITSPRARAMFEARAAGNRESLRRQTEGHIAQQRLVVQEETANATVATGLNNIAARLYAAPPEDLEREVNRMTSAVSALALTDEGRKARIAETREKAYSAAIDAHIGAGDLAGAKTMLTAHRDDVGDKADELELRIALKAKQADEAAEKARVKAVMDDVFVQLNTMHAVTPKLAKRAAVEAPKEWFELQRQLAADQRTRAHENSDKRRLQLQLDSIADSEFKALALRDPDAAAKKDLGEAWPDASPKQIARLKLEQEKTKQRIAKGDDIPLGEFNSAISKYTKGLDKKEAADFGKHMLTWWQEQLDKNKGAKPSREDALKEIGDWWMLGKSGFGFSHHHGTIDPEDEQAFTPSDDEDQPNDLARQAAQRRRGALAKPDAPAAATAPPAAAAVPAAPAKPSTPKPSKTERALSLFKAGKSKAEVQAILDAEYR